MALVAGGKKLYLPLCGNYVSHKPWDQRLYTLAQDELNKARWGYVHDEPGPDRWDRF